MSLLDFYEEVRKRADIVEVISDYISLKREGSNYKAICPFHGDNDPSLSVSPSRGIWKCFGCGKGGDVIKFVAEYEGISYFEAAKRLAQKYGIPVPTFGNKKRSPYEEALLKVLEFYRNNLLKSKRAKEYLLKERKVPAGAVEEFRLGFSPSGEALVEFARKEGIFETLRELGYIVDGKRGPIDLFWNRVTIPIFDNYGRLRGFAGRRMDNYQPKYLNSKNSEWFSKELALFGIDKARKDIEEKKRAILVEGFFDVIRLHSLGFREAIATLGTALTEGHIKIIRKYTDKVYLVYDGDQSGRKALFQNAKELFKWGLSPYVVFLPEGKDPDEFLKETGNLKTFRELLKRAKHYMELILEKIEALPTEQKEEKLKEVINLLEKVKDPVKKSVWYSELQKKFGISLNSSARRQIKSAKRKSRKKSIRRKSWRKNSKREI
jgi:DNA primase